MKCHKLSSGKPDEWMWASLFAHHAAPSADWNEFSVALRALQIVTAHSRNIIASHMHQQFFYLTHMPIRGGDLEAWARPVADCHMHFMQPSSLFRDHAWLPDTCIISSSCLNRHWRLIAMVVLPPQAFNRHKRLSARLCVRTVRLSPAPIA